MNEQDFMKQIDNQTKDIPIPDSISPENMKKMLDQQLGNRNVLDDTTDSKENGTGKDDPEKLQEMLDNTDIDFVDGNIMLDGVNVNDKIRTSEISMMASMCSAIQAVREKLVVLQRGMGQRKSIIMDGRDIGTNVLTDAECKIFLTASEEERASRRHKELIEKGEEITFEEVLEDIKQRDHNDMTRELNPLRKADDAVEVDTTGLSIQQVIDRILEEIRK